VAPSDELRRWYGHDPAKFAEFRRRYAGELREPTRARALAQLNEAARRGTVTLLTATKDAAHSQAAVLAEPLRAGPGEPGPARPGRARGRRRRRAGRPGLLAAPRLPGLRHHRQRRPPRHLPAVPRRDPPRVIPTARCRAVGV